MSLLDDWDKAWDNYYHSRLFDNKEAVIVPSTVVETREHPYLPNSVLKVFPTVNLDDPRYSSRSPISDDISMVIHSTTSPSAGLYAWSAGVFYKEHGLIVSSAGRKTYTLKGLQVLAFSAGLLCLKRPCRIDLIAKVLLFGTHRVGTRLTAIDSNIHQVICTWSRINHISKVQIPWSSYQQRVYEITARKTETMLTQYQDEAPTETMVVLERQRVTQG